MWQKPTFAPYEAFCWWERLLPVKLSKLQIHCRSSAVSWPVHNYLKHFDPYCVLSIHQAATAVSDQLQKTPPVTVTTSDTLGFVFHYSSGFLRPDRVVLCCLSYKINL